MTHLVFHFSSCNCLSYQKRVCTCCPNTQRLLGLRALVPWKTKPLPHPLIQRRVTFEAMRSSIQPNQMTTMSPPISKERWFVKWISESFCLSRHYTSWLSSIGPISASMCFRRMESCGSFRESQLSYDAPSLVLCLD